MASNFLREKNVQLRARKGHDITWACDKHAEPIKFYCKEHEISVCHPCATKDHGQKPCKLDDIEDVILDMRRKLEDQLQEIQETEKRLKRFNSEIQSSATSASDHLQSVNDEVNAAYGRKLKGVKDKEQEEIRLINEEADEEIRIINEKRNERTRTCNEEAEQQQLIIKESQAKLKVDFKTINETVVKKTEDIKGKNQHAIGKIDDMVCEITRIKQDDKTLVKKALQFIESLDWSSLSENFYQDATECLNDIEHIQHEVQRVKFVESEVGGQHFGSFDGFIGQWELVKSIDISSIVNDPRVRGFISDDEICVLDRTSNDLYVTNISSEQTEKAMKEDEDSNKYMDTTSCAPIDSNIIVCGKCREDCTGDSLDGWITLYDRKWNVIRDITIPRSTPLSTEVYVDVDRDGMIIAAQYGQSYIYTINPADGKILNTITMQDKKVFGGLQALSSGDIVMETDRKEFTIISRSGEKKAVKQCDEWNELWCSVHKMTDTLYITYQDEGRDICAVDQGSFDGNIQARRIADFVRSNRSYSPSLCLVTPSGNLVACDGDKLFVYRKSFTM